MSRRKPVSAWWKAQELLARRAHGRSELCNKLRQRGYPEAEISACEEKLLAAGWLNDREFARRLVEEFFYSRGYGYYLIQARLRQKGLDAELCGQVCDQFFSSLKGEESDRVLEKLCRRRRRQEPEKIAAWLQRRGFRGAEIKRALALMRDQADA